MTLAYDLRPKTLDQVIGQEHLTSPGKPLYEMVQSGGLSSFILYGPPGCGKTSIAQGLSGSMKLPFYEFNASIDKKDKLQKIAKESFPLVLLLDEIHRLTKPNQDFLLPYMESGDMIVVGATTENPYLSLAPAIRSRSFIFEAHPLTPKVISQYLKTLPQSKPFTPEALAHLSNSVNGDLRSALTILEILTQKERVEVEDVEAFTHQKHIEGDLDGDAHYNLLSALQKAIRGSDVNAALHYGARLLEIGDLLSLTRRLQVIAYEDIGIANYQMGILTHQACQTALAIGLPEAKIPIANVIVELALSPKSNLAYMSMNQALNDLKQVPNITIPDHLKDTHYKGAKDLGHGLTYKYPHDYPYHVVTQTYLPKDLENVQYFKTQNMPASKREQELLTRWQQIEAILHGHIPPQ